MRWRVPVPRKVGRYGMSNELPLIHDANDITPENCPELFAELTGGNKIDIKSLVIGAIYEGIETYANGDRDLWYKPFPDGEVQIDGYISLSHCADKVIRDITPLLGGTQNE